MRYHVSTIAVAVVGSIFTAVPSAVAANCNDRNTREYFEAATANEVAKCLAAGAKPMARDEARRTSLHLAVILANAAAVKELLDAGADVNASGADGYTPLHIAAQSTKGLAVITVLLDAGADVNARNKKGQTALHIAARADKNPAIAAALLDAGADVNARNGLGDTPLHEAARYSEEPAVITIFLDAGADVNASDAYGLTPLHWAAGAGSAAVSTALLDAGADAKAKDLGGSTPWDFAKDNNKLKGTDVYWRLNDARF